jgi:hypothetical protein
MNIFYILDLVTRKIYEMQIKYNSNAYMFVSQANSASEAGQWVVNGSLNRDQVATA